MYNYQAPRRPGAQAPRRSPRLALLLAGSLVLILILLPVGTKSSVSVRVLACWRAGVLPLPADTLPQTLGFEFVFNSLLVSFEAFYPLFSSH